MSPSEHSTQVARNEARFREYNESVDADATERRRKPQPLVFFCECGDAECHAFLEIGADSYEDARSSPRQFIVLPGHEKPDVEDVVGVHDSYVVVHKRDDVAEIVEGSDPRRWER